MRINTYRIFFFFALALSFFSCDNGKASKDQVEKAYREVMTVHDKAMGNMDKLHNTTKDLKNQLGTHPADSLAIKEAIAALDKATDGMMDWMGQFSSQYEKWPADSAVHYLNRQKKDAETMATAIETALGAAAKLKH